MRNNYIKKTLSNGVKLYLYLDKNMKQYYIDYIIDYGSLGKWYDFYLDDKLHHVLPGCAHFLEHILGEHSKYGDFYKYLASKKYYKNGGTSDLATHYFFKGTKDILDSLEKLINVVDDPVFTKEDVEITKHAIIEETKISNNDKMRTLLCLIQRNLYKGLDLYDESLSSIGNEKTTEKIDYDMLKACYDAFYYDENKTLLIAGNFNELEITEYVEKIYSKLKPHQKRVKEYKYNNLDQIKNKYEEYSMTTSNDIIGIAFKEIDTKYSKKEVYYYLNFINSILFSNSSDFINRLKKDKVLVDFKSFVQRFIYNDNFIFYIMATVNNKDLFEKELIKELKTIEYSEKDFNLYIRSEISNFALGIDNKYNQFNSFIFRKWYTDDFDDIDFLKTLTYNNFLEFYNTLNFDDYVVGIITN